MPGAKLNDTERRLASWWQSGGASQYPTLRSITLEGNPGLRGITKFELQFDYPLSVICGKNGCGKTTILSLAALGFHSPQGHKSINARRSLKKNQDYTYYTFQDFFYKGPGDPDITGLKIAWGYGNPRSDIEILKHSDKWMRYERRPVRPVHYLGIIRSIPAIEQRVLRSQFAGNVKKAEPKPLNTEFIEIFSHIMGKVYSEADVLSLQGKHHLRRVTTQNTYTSFNMGAGEDILFEILYLLQDSPPGSLIVIEEIELGLHPEALIRLARKLQEIIHSKKLQVIVSSHSEHFIDAVPRQARVLLQKNAGELEVIKHPTTKYAIGNMSNVFEFELNIFCEDVFASKLIKKALPLNLRRRVNIIPIGSNSDLCKAAQYNLQNNPSQKIHIVWDGDTTDSKIQNWLRSVKSEYRDKFTYSKLPGNLPPESWLLEQLNSEEGFALLDKTLELNSLGRAEQLFQHLLTIDDKHDIGFQVAEQLDMDEILANEKLIECVSQLSHSPLNALRVKIDDVFHERVPSW